MKLSDLKDPEGVRRRFYAKIVQGDYCWEWTEGSRFPSGYGYLKVRLRSGKRISMRTNRLSLLLENGEVDDNLYVLHHCDNPACARPSHLYEGTPADNMRDKVARGRWKGGSPPGERQACAKLKEVHVREIRLRYATEQISCYRLAKSYGVTTAAVWNIVHGRTWKHVV